MTWTGFLEPQFTETYTFEAEADDGLRVWIGDDLIVDSWGNDGHRSARWRVRAAGDRHIRTARSAFGQGRRYPIRIEYYERRNRTPRSASSGPAGVRNGRSFRNPSSFTSDRRPETGTAWRPCISPRNDTWPTPRRTESLRHLHSNGRTGNWLYPIPPSSPGQTSDSGAGAGATLAGGGTQMSRGPLRHPLTGDPGAVGLDDPPGGLRRPHAAAAAEGLVTRGHLTPGAAYGLLLHAVSLEVQVQRLIGEDHEVSPAGMLGGIEGFEVLRRDPCGPPGSGFPADRTEPSPESRCEFFTWKPPTI